MHRFYLPPAECSSATLTLRDREAHHGAQVLRLQPGERVAVLDGAGSQLDCEVTQVSRKEIRLAVRDRIRAPRAGCELTLMQAIVKGKTMETIVEKATELGVTRIVPLLTERVVSHLDSERAESKQAKWQVIAIEAIKQCGSPWLPRIEPPATIQHALKYSEGCDLAIVGSLRGDAKHLRQWIEPLAREGRKPRAGCVWIGPEGDFTNGELDTIEAAGARPITLGTLVLRADTAAISSLAVLRHELGWLNETAPAP
jgi:16S rRNA (uracil1498-N3)-methyltransferase